MQLTAKPLTAEAFAPYGDVIDTSTAETTIEINYGLTTRFHDMAKIDVEERGGKAGFSIFRAKKIPLPHEAKVMEYHPYGSQLFYPTSKTPFLILVAPPSEKLPLDKLELFISNGGQGVNYHKKTWHHYLMALDESSDFIVVDWIGNEKNCVEENITESVVLKK